MLKKGEELPLAIAAQRLGMSWHRAWAAVLSGRLKARRTDEGRWLVDATDLARYERQRRSIPHFRSAFADGSSDS